MNGAKLSKCQQLKKPFRGPDQRQGICRKERRGTICSTMRGHNLHSRQINDFVDTKSKQKLMFGPTWWISLARAAPWPFEWPRGCPHRAGPPWPPGRWPWPGPRRSWLVYWTGFVVVADWPTVWSFVVSWEWTHFRHLRTAVKVILSTMPPWPTRIKPSKRYHNSPICNECQTQ